MEIRPATQADVGAIAAVHLAAATTGFAHIFPPDAPRPTVEGLEGQWSSRLVDGEVVVADERGSIVGVVGLGAGHVFGLYVHPSRWAEGIGRALHDHAIARLRDHGHRTATLWVLEHNVRARRWYERLGWELTGTTTWTLEAHGIRDLGYALDLP